MSASTVRRPDRRPLSFRTCRHCLGNGCLHCNQRGQVRERVFSRPDAEAARLRRLIFAN